MTNANLKTLAELEKSAHKDLLLAALIIPKALEDDDQDALEVGILAASEGLGVLKATRLLKGEKNENEVFYQDLGLEERGKR